MNFGQDMGVVVGADGHYSNPFADQPDRASLFDSVVKSLGTLAELRMLANSKA